YGLAEVPSDWGACVATIGEFDGVHRGHQRVVERAREIAQSRQLPVVAITFDPHPDEVIRPGSHPPLLTTARRRSELLAGLAAAARALGRPHRVEGVVVRGHMRGRGLGFPTANLETPPHTATPADGIYAGWLTSLDLDGTETARWPAAISVGTNPTFGVGDR